MKFITLLISLSFGLTLAAGAVVTCGDREYSERHVSQRLEYVGYDFNPPDGVFDGTRPYQKVPLTGYDGGRGSLDYLIVDSSDNLVGAVTFASGGGSYTMCSVS